MSMVERVAKAIDECPEWPAKTYRSRMALAAIEAMRDPSNDMTAVGWREAEKRDAILGNGEIAIIFNAMIDAALSSQQVPA